MRKILISVSILILLALAGCTKIEYKYVCANGIEVTDKTECPTNKVAGVKKIEADGYARNFVNAYAGARQGRAQLVSSYLDPDQGDYFATFVFTEQDDKTYQTVVKVDGKTGQVECNQGCDYVGKAQ